MDNKLTIEQKNAIMSLQNHYSALQNTHALNVLATILKRDSNIFFVRMLPLVTRVPDTSYTEPVEENNE